MKKKILIGLVAISLIFLLGGVYIISTIETATSKLDNLIMLHQVEILREQLLLQIQGVQSDINLKNTRHARNIETVVKNVRNMEQMAETCLDCHHSRDMEQRLSELQDDVEKYKKSVSRLFTIRANTERLQQEEDKAFKIGEHLIENVNNMISMASIKLESKTQKSLESINETKKILYLLITLVPLLAGGLAFIFIRDFSSQFNVLLTAIRQLKRGDMDYKVKGLTDEFGELAESFNEMSDSLKANMHSIRENEKKYRALFDSAGDAIFMVEADGENQGRITAANRAAAVMHEYTVEDIVGMNLFKDIDSPEDEDNAPGRIKQMFDGQWISAEITHRKKDGTIFPVEASAGIFEFMGKKYILAFDRDITDRKQAEQALMRSYIMFTTVLDSIDSIIYVADMETYEVLYLNKYARNIFGDIEGKICWQHIQAAQDGPCSFCSNDKLLTPDGVPTGVCHMEILSTFNGMWYEVYDRAIEWVDGRIVRFEIATDISERNKMDQTLKRAEQMKLVGEWAAGLAHEIKNALAGIKISVEVMGEAPNIEEDDKETIVMVVDEIKRIELLLRRMLDFARPPELQLFVTNVNELLDNALNYSIMQPALSKGNEQKTNVLKVYDNDLLTTMADRLQLRQVFMNLIMNANEAMQYEGTLTLKTYYEAAANSIYIEISDTGEGLEEEVIDKIFNPFFTTKSKGSGLGLAISKRIVELHGGDIYAKNKPDGGVLFTIRIPVREVGKESQ